jgi:AGZA family xanthine/uracil permease-like MFS transporter
MISLSPDNNSAAINWRTEILAGLTTFLTMSYIVVVNPSILATPGTGMSFSGVLTATVTLSCLMTLLMGIYARLPFAVAPGMGINSFFTFTLILGEHIPWPVALGMVFWSGVLFVVISATPLRVAVAHAIPLSLRNAAAAGIGIFLAFIGMKNTGLIVADPATLVRLGNLSPQTALSLVGGVLMLVLFRRKSPVAFLAGIAVITAVAAVAGWVRLPSQWIASPDFHSVFFKLDPVGALRLALVPSILSVLFTDLFDSISTFVGVSQATDLLDRHGQPMRLKEGLIVDAFATLGAGLVGTSSGTAFIESSAGIEVGGRTGWTSIVTAACFLPCLFLAPWAAMVPDYATAPVLVIVGALMFRSVTTLPMRNIEDCVPAFLTTVLIPLTFSITQGILWGFIAHTVLYWLVGRRREVPPMMNGLALLSVGLLLAQHGHW